MQNVVILKNDLESDFAAAIYLSEPPLPVTHCIHNFTHKAGLKNMTESTQEISYLQSMNSDNHLPQSPYFSYATYLSYAAPCLSYAAPCLSYAAPYLS
jgi:hypothetical protein